MTILTNGNVGINTSTPSSSLDVSGGTIGISSENLTLSVNSTGAGGKFVNVAGQFSVYATLEIQRIA